MTVQNIDSRHSITNIVKGNQYNRFHRDDSTSNALELERVERNLSKLHPVMMDASTRSGCLDDTRADVIADIRKWVVDPAGKSMLWLWGLVGSGKSTLLTSIAEALRKDYKLGAFVFFNRDVAERCDPSIVVRTLAFELGMSNIRIGTEIANSITENPRIMNAPLRLQFQKLLLEPLIAFGKRERAAPLVIVLDALDECGHPRERQELLKVIGEETSKLPSFLRILIASRKDGDINQALGSRNHIQLYELDICSATNEENISYFFRSNLARIRETNGYLGLGDDWPKSTDIRELTKRALGLFIWAATAVQFVAEGHDPRERLKILLKGRFPKEAESSLDELYRTALRSVGKWSDPDFIRDFRDIMGIILNARNPLTNKGIDGLSLQLSHDSRPSLHTISRLGCVLSQENFVRVLHPSFAEYLTDRSRCGNDPWFIDEVSQNDRLAIQCLKVLDQNLKYNFHEISFDRTLPYQHLAEETEYASLYWVDHVCSADDEGSTIAEAVSKFMSERLLLWLEAMSAMDQSRKAIEMLSLLSVWLSAAPHEQQGLNDLVNDGYRFAQYFADLFENHPLLVYSSALTFTPMNTALYRTFHQRIPIPRVLNGQQISWPPLFMVIGVNSKVNSIAISPNGKYIVSGSEDSTIGVWDAHSGAKWRPQMAGHSGPVICVAFSPNGDRIASLSKDSTVRFWNVESGTAIAVFRIAEGDRGVTCMCFSRNWEWLVLGDNAGHIKIIETETFGYVVAPYQGHKQQINALAFHPDGSRFVSGSIDSSIRTWETSSGIEVIPPIVAQGGSIRSISISSNGKKIVSGSTDKTISIWDAHSGEAILGPIRSHDMTRSIHSVVFTPNDRYIVSGAENGTIRVWDATLGSEACEALRGHHRPIKSLAVSNDGRRIISGSSDGSIRVWNIDNSSEPIVAQRKLQGAVTALAISPSGSRIAASWKDKVIQVWDVDKEFDSLLMLRGHEDIVLSLAFSSDEQQIVSGAGDREDVIRTWRLDTSHGVPACRPLRGRQIGGTLCVAFSPDQSLVAAGSTEKTVRVWDVTKGTESVVPLKGHRDAVSCLEFCRYGKHVISGSKDFTVRIWELDTATQIFVSLGGHNSMIQSVGFSHDGSMLLSKSTNHVMAHTWSQGDVPCTRLSRKPAFTHRSSHVLDSIAVDSNGWILDVKSQRKISKLPPAISLDSLFVSAARGSNLVLVTDRGVLTTIQFPTEGPFAAAAASE